MSHCVKIKVVQLDGNILERIGIAIRLLRKGKGLTQLELSERCGVDRKFISSIERGNRNCSILTLCQITHALDTNLENFFRSLPPAHSNQPKEGPLQGIRS